jgi:hypothetical protein
MSDILNNRRLRWQPPTSFTKRFCRPNSGTAFRQQLALAVARAIAEDANTCIYVREYDKGHFDQREDYIAYVANRVEWIMQKHGLS